ncbi:unnamed protein product [Prorocentrum cordatum]|uniref:Uncharacterized protein n=1 Tax=Prorocentrum cordatum TaxID=2364126 RepID=A0ABN9VZ95_9DINO|nr:unnamed protein product [Polarella glacialis]
MHAVSDTLLWVQLHRLDQLVGDGRAMADGCGAVERGVGGEAAGARSHLFHGSALVSYSAGISACEKGEQWQPALALLSEMWEAKLEPDVISYSAGISACGKSEQWHRALALLSEMREAQLEPNVNLALCPRRPD